MKYIETLREGERVLDIYLCKKKQSAMTKNGKAYDNLTLQDKTGVLMRRFGIQIRRELMNLRY